MLWILAGGDYDDTFEIVVRAPNAKAAVAQVVSQHSRFHSRRIDAQIAYAKRNNRLYKNSKSKLPRLMEVPTRTKYTPKSPVMVSRASFNRYGVLEAVGKPSIEEAKI